MIAVSVMLAIFLGWPLVFGDKAPPPLEVAPAQAHATAPARTTPATQATEPGMFATAAPRVGSCYKRFLKEAQLCTGRSSAACRLTAGDNWDLCEATGFWPQ